MRRLAYAATLSGLLLALPASAQDDVPANPWPREIQVTEGTVVMYQPQPEALEGNQLKARAAVSVELQGGEVPIFGVVWFEARLDTDRAERVAGIVDVRVTQLRFPEQLEDQLARLTTLLETEIPRWELVISMDRLLTSLELAEQRDQAAAGLNNDPPVILFEDEPAILVTIDGEPRLTQEEGTDLMRVINTPYSLLLDPQSQIYYLNADATTWYTATDIVGEWAVADSVPMSVAALAPQPDELESEVQEGDDAEPGPPPKIIVATVPTELISATAGAEYTPITGTDLLYMSNTESDLFLHLTDQQHYVLLTGRWFKASSVEGPWSYVPGDELPEDFARIPEDHQMGTVLYAVPGTDLAIEAVMDAQIPQTATIQRAEAGLDVEYDGEPEFDEITGTPMTYAINSPTPVILVNGLYYACDEAVWFVAANPAGPWAIATQVPDVIYTIPPESSIYNVTYVRIYDSTPEVVYVGYTSGYTGTYIYGTTIVYGTGFYYPYWYGRYYYPRPSTWGFHVRYNPWSGWSFGLSYSAGPFTFYVGRGGWYRGGWWGPARYRGYRRGFHRGYRRGYRAGYRAGQRNSARNNMYRSQRNQTRGATTGTLGAANRAGSSAGGNRDNNVFADRNGNVHRNTGQGWEQRTGQGWQGSGAGGAAGGGQAARPATQPTTRPTTQPATRPSTQPTTRPTTQPSSSTGSRSSYSSMTTTQQLNSSQSSRQRGSQRTNSYNTSRGGASRGGGGGGRRR